MPGSQTEPGRPRTRADAPVHVAFRVRYRVGTRDEKSFAAPYLAYALPYRRFAVALTDASARLGVDVVRYSFIAVDSHHLLLAGLPGAHRTIPHAWAFCPYTLVIVASNHAAHSTVFKKLSFDPIKNFEPVAFTHVVPLMLVVNPSVPANNVQELVAYAKAHPGELNYASSGKGSSLQMAAEMFKSATGTDIMEVVYKGSTAAHPDL